MMNRVTVSGLFAIQPGLDEAQAKYLQAFASTWRVQRDRSALTDRPDPLREGVGLPLGVDGAFYVNGTSIYEKPGSRPEDNTVVEWSTPPGGHPGDLFVTESGVVEAQPTRRHVEAQPSVVSAWRVTNSGLHVVWNGHPEGSVHAAVWLQYLIDHFFTPWDHTLKGKALWTEDGVEGVGTILADHGRLTISLDNKATGRRKSNNA